MSKKTPADYAKIIAGEEVGNESYRKVWMWFLIAFPSVITVATFSIVVLSGLCSKVNLPPAVLLALIGKSAVADIGIMSYVTVTKNLFPATAHKVDT